MAPRVGAQWRRVIARVHRSMRSVLCLLAMVGVAAAEPTVRVTPERVHPGDPVLVTVTDVDETPKGRLDGKPLHFFPAKRGYQALYAVPLDEDADSLALDVAGVKQDVTITAREFPEADVVVEEEYANPPAAQRTQIDADNKAMIDAMKDDTEDAQFTRAFQRPRGAITSPFGEWRTFNDGHRSQHLGFDVFAKVGAPVKAINAGTVTLVRDTFLAGKVVIVSHGVGIASGYFHLSESSVTEGQVIKAGERIGLAGESGRTTGPHLHLAVRVPGGFVNPATFFKLAIAPATTEQVAKRTKSKGAASARKARPRK